MDTWFEDRLGPEREQAPQLWQLFDAVLDDAVRGGSICSSVETISDLVHIYCTEKQISVPRAYQVFADGSGFACRAKWARYHAKWWKNHFSQRPVVDTNDPILQDLLLYIQEPKWKSCASWIPHVLKDGPTNEYDSDDSSEGSVED
jgi:hypothetical protein